MFIRKKKQHGQLISIDLFPDHSGDIVLSYQKIIKSINESSFYCNRGAKTIPLYVSMNVNEIDLTSLMQVKNSNIRNIGFQISAKVSNLKDLVEKIQLIKEHNFKVSISDLVLDFRLINELCKLDVDEIVFDLSPIEKSDVTYDEFCHFEFLYSVVKRHTHVSVVNYKKNIINRWNILDFIDDEPSVVGDKEYLSSLSLLTQNDFSNVNINHVKNYKEIFFKIIQQSKLLDSNCVELNDRFQSCRDLKVISDENIDNTIHNFKTAVFHEKKISELFLSSLIESSDKIVVVRNDKGVAIYENDAHKLFTGMSIVGIAPEKLLKLNPNYKICLDKDKSLLINESVTFNEDKEIYFGVEYLSIREKINFNGAKFVISTITPMLSCLSDACCDELTGCYSRSFLSYSIMSFSDYSLIFLDLDGFKMVNDTYGHIVGDLCLVDFVKLLKSNLRSEDLIIRYGGDEFILLIKSKNVDFINKKMNTINNNTSQFFGSKGYNLSFSYGLAALGGKDDFDKALSLADKKMYEHKKSRKLQRV